MWRERGAGGGEARFERDAAEQPPPDLSALAAAELGRRGRFARRLRDRRPPSPVCTAVGAHVVSCWETWVAGGAAAHGTRHPGCAGERRRRPIGRRRVPAPGRRRRTHPAGSFCRCSPGGPLSLEGEGCRGKGKDGAASWRFPGVALLEDVFLLQSLKRSVSRKSSVELGVSCGQAFAPSI